MAAEIKRRNLGKGLSALLGEASEDYAKLDRVRSPRAVPIELLRPSPYQPRHRMAEQDLENLAQSVAEKGILQPILVRRHADEPDAFEIIAGERRWRAAQMAQLHEVPVVVKELSDREALEIALVENLQRQDLSPLEEAEGYRRLMEEFTHTQEDLARSVSKSRSHVANMMRLLGLPEPVKAMLDSAELSAGHARALLGAEDAAGLARQVVKRGLNVRQTERLVKSGRAAGKRRSRTAEKDVDTLALERDLSNLLGLAVEVKLRADGGALILHYRSLDQLDDILHRLSHGTRGGLSDVEVDSQALREHSSSGDEELESSEGTGAIISGYFSGNEPSG
jgi:ParB family chromosome partitioning protein